MKKLHLVVVFVLGLGEPAFSTPVQFGQCGVPDQTVRLVLLSQPARRGTHRNTPRVRLMAAFSETSQRSEADGFCEAKAVALMCTARLPSAISWRVTE